MCDSSPFCWIPSFDSNAGFGFFVVGIHLAGKGIARFNRRYNCGTSAGIAVASLARAVKLPVARKSGFDWFGLSTESLSVVGFLRLCRVRFIRLCYCLGTSLVPVLTGSMTHILYGVCFEFRPR